MPRHQSQGSRKGEKGHRAPNPTAETGLTENHKAGYHLYSDDNCTAAVKHKAMDVSTLEAALITMQVSSEATLVTVMACTGHALKEENPASLSTLFAVWSRHVFVVYIVWTEATVPIHIRAHTLEI